MKKILSFMVLAMICGVAVCGAAKLKTKDWAQFGRYKKANVALSQAPRVVMYGNSITDFWIKNDSVFFAENNLIDRGISGQTTSEMLVRFRQDVIELHPKAVVILAGINDIAMNNGPMDLKNAMGNIASMAELAKLHKIKPILCTVLPCDKLSWRPEVQPATKVRELNAMIAKYAKENKITVVDYYSQMSTPEGALKPEWVKDHCHPNLAGYKVMESIVLPVINKVVK